MGRDHCVLGQKGWDARLRRMLRARQEYKRRQPGCIGAWMGTGAESSSMMLVQSAFVSAADWKRVSTEIQTVMDAEDGGIEGLLLGPPLVRMFEIPNEELKTWVSLRMGDFACHLTSHNVSYATTARFKRSQALRFS